MKVLFISKTNATHNAALRVALIYASFSLLWILFSDQILLYFVKDYEEVLQLSINDLSLGEHPYSQQEAMDLVKRAIEHGPQLFEWMCRKKSDECFWSEVALESYEVDEQRRVIAVVRDITEKKKIEEQLFLNEKLATIAGLAAGVAHEINTPLSAILQSQQMIEMRLDPDKPRNRKRAAECGVDLTKVDTYFKNNELDFFMKGMRDSAITAGNIIKNLLEFSRPHKGEIRNTNLPMLLDASLELARADYELKKQYDIINVEIIKEYDPDLIEVPCVAMEFEQVILNLIKNATHAMGDDNTENPCITIRTVKTEKMARIEVEDNGPGIDEETQLHIFDPFFTTKEVGQGTGLGLSVSHAIIVDKHKGNIWVESESGKGAKFIIELPLSQEG